MGGFGATVNSSQLGPLLGGFEAAAFAPGDLDLLLTQLSPNGELTSLDDVAAAFADGTLSSTQLGLVLGGFGGSLSTNQAALLGTLLGGFGTNTLSVSELGSLLGGFGNALPSSEQAALGQLLGGFGQSSTSANLGGLLGGFGATASSASLGQVLGGFGAVYSTSQLGSLLSGFGGTLSSMQLGSLLGGFGAGLSATQLGSLLGGFGATISSTNLGQVLGGFEAATFADGDLELLLAELDPPPEAGLASLSDIATAFAAGSLGSVQLGSVLGGFGGSLTSNQSVILGTLLGGFGTGSTSVFELGSLLGGFGNSLSLSQQAALGQLLGGFGQSVNTAELGSLLGGFGATASAASLGSVLGGFGSALSTSQLGSLLGGFGGSVTTAQLGALLGGFGAGLTSTQLGSLLGGFGGVISSTEIGSVLGGYEDVALGDGDLDLLLAALSPDGALTSLAEVANAFGGGSLNSVTLGSVLGGFGGSLSTNQAALLGTLLGGFGTGVSSLSDLGSLLGGFGNSLASSQLSSLGQLLGGFGQTASSTDVGSLLGGFGAVASTAVLGPVLGGFGAAVTTQQLGSLLGGFGGSVSSVQFGALLGGFGAGLSASQLGSLLGGFGASIKTEDLGSVLGGFEGVAFPGGVPASLLEAFSAVAGEAFTSLEDVASALFGGTLSSAEIGSVLGGFGGSLTSSQSVVLGTLLGGFGTGVRNVTELGSLLGGFGNSLNSAELTALGQLLGGFGATIGASSMGKLLGGFAASSNVAALSAVTTALLDELGEFDTTLALRGFADSQDATGLGTLVAGVVVAQSREEVLTQLATLDGLIDGNVLAAIQTSATDFFEGATNLSQLVAQLADSAVALTPGELDQLFESLTRDLDSARLGTMLAGFSNSLDTEAVGVLISGFVDSSLAPVLQAFLSSLRTTVTAGSGNDTVSGVVMATFQTAGGDDHLFAGTVDATSFVGAFQLAGFSAATAHLALSASGSVFHGGTGDDTYYLLGEKLGHLTINEYGQGGVDTSVDSLDLSGFGGGAATIDLGQTTEQTVHQGALWLRLSDDLGMEYLTGTDQADILRGNARDNRISGADPLDDRAVLPPMRDTQTQFVYLDFDSETEAGEHVYSATEREMIRTQLNRYYLGPDNDQPWFDFQFVFEPPAAGPYETVFFNRTPDNEAAGGLSNEIDFRNLNFDTTVFVDVNGLLGGSGQPAATSDNYAAMSITIAAHEVAHSAGARHFHATGPIGFGTHIPPGREAYQPDYAGLAGAYETTLHIMSSPASLGSSLAQALQELFFSERTAIVLSFAQQGVVVEESPTTTQQEAGQSLGELPGLRVPKTISQGLNAHKDLAVAAVAVVGSIEIGADGKSENDLYSFSGRAGDVINIEVLSSSLTRYAGNSIDSVVRVYDENRNLVPYYGSPFGAFNDDQFEPGDALIIDLRSPANGTYYVEVDSFHVGLDEFIGPDGYAPPGFSIDGFCSGDPAREDACNDTDIGAYELFLYRVDAGNTSDGGDEIDGRDGNDIVIGLSGNDVMSGGGGNDQFLFDDRSIKDTDTVDGGDGEDGLDFSDRTAGIDINLAQVGTGQNIGGGQVILLKDDLEDVIGTLAADHLVGNRLDNVLIGDPGNDPTVGGDDTIVGGPGNDILIGHGGADKIVGSSGNDVIVGGFGDDRLVGSSGNDILYSGELLGTYDDEALPEYSGQSWWNNVELFRAIRQLWLDQVGSGLVLSDRFDYGNDDDDNDEITGSSGEDWLVIGDDDRVTDD